ncbi:kinesin protein KIFC1-like [Tropilaelaps mercedesae]|uniref:Kinesin protein KIFC1-like n=1 Tax=Tropilaelaps mercedesae TaxID=418985 RepID=A0A1V9X7S9_9ACAR|nr:kinesin protein KIFC1-like [Tropilaelaps mercedesae]
MLDRIKRQLSDSSIDNEPKRSRSNLKGSSVTPGGRSTPNEITGPRKIAVAATLRRTPALRRPNTQSKLTPSAVAAISTGRITPSAHLDLKNQPACNKDAPPWSRQEICKKLAALEQHMENNQATPLKAPSSGVTIRKPLTAVAQTRAPDQTIRSAAHEQTTKSALVREELRQRTEENEWVFIAEFAVSQARGLKQEKLQLVGQMEILQNDLRQLKAQLESKATKLEILEKNYQLLDSEHRALKRDLNTQEAENTRLAKLFASQRDESERLSAKLEAAVNDREAARQRVRNNEARMRYLHNQMLELKGNIRVFARIRPITDTEGAPTMLVAPDETLTVIKPNAKPGGKPTKVAFRFDRVLPAEVGQAEVFEEVEQLVVSALDGYNVCIFAYGQTGTGKTYTMEGPPGLDFDDQSQAKHFGIIPRALHRVFELTEERFTDGWEYALEASFLEIYNETLHDLLDRDKGKECQLRQAADPQRGEVVFVDNLTTVSVKSIRQIAQLIEKARRNRSVAATKCNERSSRSHCVFQLRITGRNSTSDVCRESLLNLVDLAGSERAKQSGAEGIRLTEMKSINSSLTQLSTVMMSLGNKAAHIPYRNSKLTHLLSTSLGGNSKTLMLVNISPAAGHVNETLNSLKFAQKVNEVHIGPASRNAK